MPFEYLVLIIDEIDPGINFYPESSEPKRVRHAANLSALLQEFAADGWEVADSLPLSWQKELDTFDLASWRLILRRPQPEA